MASDERETCDCIPAVGSFAGLPGCAKCTPVCQEFAESKLDDACALCGCASGENNGMYVFEAVLNVPVLLGEEPLSPAHKHAFAKRQLAVCQGCMERPFYVTRLLQELALAESMVELESEAN